MNDDTKPPSRTAKPESLEAKFMLMTRLPYDRRIKRKHSVVFGFILDWYHSRYGDALASVRHIVATLKERDPFGVGLYVGDVHAALSDLVAWGYLEQVKGAGRRASRYVPNWDLVCSVHKSPNTTDDDRSVLVSPNAGVLVFPNTTGDSVRDFPNEDPSTLIRSQDPDTGKDELDCATPTAPPAAGLSAAAAVMAQGGFEELYRTYDVRKEKAAAKRAYEKLAPDTDLHAAMVVAAEAWRVAGGAVERMHLARWIREERYDEDPGVGRRQPTAEATAKISVARPKRATTRIVDIVDSKVDATPGQAILWLTFAERDRPSTWTHKIIIEHADVRRQADGQEEFSELRKALGLYEVNDSQELHHPVTLTGGAGDKLKYAPANDNAIEEAA